jgi:hypothetical protein
LACSGSISPRRCAAYAFEISCAVGCGTKSGSARYLPRSAKAIFSASAIRWSAVAEDWPAVARSKPSRMFSISRIATPPLVGGGIANTVLPR